MNPLAYSTGCCGSSVCTGDKLEIFKTPGHKASHPDTQAKNAEMMSEMGLNNLDVRCGVTGKEGLLTNISRCKSRDRQPLVFVCRIVL